MLSFSVCRPWVNYLTLYAAFVCFDSESKNVKFSSNSWWTQQVFHCCVLFFVKTKVLRYLVNRRKDCCPGGWGEKEADRACLNLPPINWACLQTTSQLFCILRLCYLEQYRSLQGDKQLHSPLIKLCSAQAQMFFFHGNVFASKGGPGGMPIPIVCPNTATPGGQTGQTIQPPLPK